jgi:type II secretion system protein L
MRIFGVEAGSGFIRAAVVEKLRRGTRIIRLASMTLAAGERNSASLGEFAVRLGFNGEKDMLATVFPGERVTQRVIKTPLRKRPQIAQTLPFELESRVPMAADEFVCGFTIIGQGEDGGRVLAALAKNTDIREFLAIFAEAGLDPDVIAPGPLAAAAGLGSGAAKEPGARAVVHGGPGAVYITIIGEGGEPLTFHTSSSGAGEAEKIGMEIDRLILGLMRETPDIKLASVALGGKVPGMASLLRQRLMIPAIPAELDGAPEPETDELADGPMEERKALFLAALGAAYMAAGAAEPVNLRTGQFEKTTRRSGQNREAMVAAKLLLAAALLWMVSFIGDGVMMSREYSSLKTEIRDVFKAAMPETKTIVSEKQQIMAELSRMEGAAKALGVGRGGDPFLDIMLDVTKAKPGNVKLAIDDMTYEPGRLILTGRTESFEKIDQFKNNLEKLAWVAKARLDKAKAAASKGDVTFRIEADVAL